QDKVRAMKAQLDQDCQDLKLKAECDIEQLPEGVRNMSLKRFLVEFNGDVSLATRKLMGIRSHHHYQRHLQQRQFNGGSALDEFGNNHHNNPGRLGYDEYGEDDDDITKLPETPAFIRSRLRGAAIASHK
ncbi:hypothetical protein H4219_005859, partial [Mycoemilia scoparia]